MLTDLEWEAFNDLLGKIVNGDGNWQDKAQRVQDNTDSNTLSEFVMWFSQEDDEDDSEDDSEEDDDIEEEDIEEEDTDDSDVEERE